MRIGVFEELVAAKKMRIERKVKHGDKELLICEGYSRGDRDSPAPHYKTMYAIADDMEHITTGEFFTTEILFPIKSKDVRLFEAEQRAREFADNMGAECPA